MSRFVTLALIALTIVLGVLSRLVPTGWVVIDKYFGDALYAVLIYLLIRLVNPKATVVSIVLVSGLIVVAIECFQLTLIPLRLSQSVNLFERTVAVVLGTKFNWLDILAYAVGVAVIGLLDKGKGRDSSLRSE